MTSFLSAIEQWFSEHFGWLASFFAPVADAIYQAGGTLLVSAAQQAVAAVAADPSIIGSDTKRAAAFTMISQSLQAQGIQAGISVINVALELAVQGLKK